MQKRYTFLALLALSSLLFTSALAQKSTRLNFIDSAQNWSYNFQLTAIKQYHPAFSAAYSGKNSLRDVAESALSLTSTAFLGRRLWQNASVFFNPEIAGGGGVSSSLGIAAFPNGETFRIGNPAPALYVARCFIRQHFHLKGEYDDQAEGFNQVPEKLYKHRLVLTAGKFSLADIFDNNNVAHDARMDFMNWAFMDNGAWDYPANTRGYTTSIVAEYYRLNWVFRGGASLVASTANGPKMDWDIRKAHGLTFELERKLTFAPNRQGSIRLLLFSNNTKASSYQQVINQFQSTGDSSTLNVYNSNQYNGLKYGGGINFDLQLTNNLFCFGRIGWNNGKTATWAFTEIDQTASGGIRLKGKKWKRPQDNIGIAGVVNGISKTHKEFLNYGGYGFMLGDGKLTHYGHETVLEVFYESQIASSLFLTFDYQFVKNPGYNKDRGPVNLFALRVHFSFK